MTTQETGKTRLARVRDVFETIADENSVAQGNSSISLLMGGIYKRAFGAASGWLGSEKYSRTGSLRSPEGPAQSH